MATQKQNEYLQHKSLQVDLKSHSCWSSLCPWVSKITGYKTPGSFDFKMENLVTIYKLPKTALVGCSV